MTKKTKQKWCADGLRFRCAGSGNCCKTNGEYSYVYLTKLDIDRLSKHLNMSKTRFLRQFTQQLDGERIIKDPSRDCIFFEASRCTVYKARPKQCRTWPFWGESLTKDRWKEIKKICPGIGKGKKYSWADIRSFQRQR
ncbi:YkgJ family cysteine cluster protein [Bdellovibrionota bacterium]